MKKSLVTLALMSAFASASAAEVQVYGVVDAGFQSVKSGDVSVSGIDSGLASDSRIGFKGKEDLGNGLSAKFVLEQAISVDDGSSAVGSSFSRQAWLGLSSNLGEVRLGRQHTPLYETVSELDPFGAGLAGNATTFLGYGSYLLRADNAVTYIAPSFAGLNAKVQYGFGESVDSTKDNRVLGFSAGYDRGPIGVNLAYNTQNFNGVGLDDKQSDLLLGATYDFNVAKAHVAYGQSKFEDKVAATEDKLKNFMLGVSAPVGSNGLVMASYIRSDVKDLDEGKSNQFSLGYSHSLSKRTKLYTSYAHVSNDNNTDVRAVANGESTRVVNVGINHSF